MDETTKRPALETVRVVVKGLVQGVGYRDAARRHASGLGLRGWVRNLPDGTVELVAQGPTAAIGQLVQWCARGPRGARVAGTSVESIDPAGAGIPAGFIVRR